MAGTWPKFIRDPIHDLIRFDDIPLDRLLLRLINSREFQRLRRIKQLGFSDTVFPGATHTRFAHSIGVMWNAKRFIKRLEFLSAKESPTEPYVSEPHRTVIVVGALLHDLGHGPFSHAFEKVTKIKHERRTVEIILDKKTKIYQILADENNDGNPLLPEQIASLFPQGFKILERYLGKEPEYKCPKYLQDIVSSQFDADRADYLIRDSHFSGTEYGRFDLQWMIDHLFVDPTPKKERLYFSPKAHQAVESYVFARYHMYQSVYFHKATRASEIMLCLLFDRIKNLVDGEDDTLKNSLIAKIPKEFQGAFTGKLSTADFLKLDDHSATALLREMVDFDDQTLSYLAIGLLDRKLYKCIDLTRYFETERSKTADFLHEVKDWLKANNAASPVELDSSFPNDDPSDTPYKIYDPDSAFPATQIYIEIVLDKIVELSKASGSVAALAKEITLTRRYFPAEIRDKIDELKSQYLDS